MAVKRKAVEIENTDLTHPSHAKRLLASSEAKSAFRSDLFETQTIAAFKNAYTISEPYPHAVIPNLITDSLLRNVRSEITTNIHFTLKETDIYRIHQSGDLANLSNLDEESLKRLPSLVRLRDVLYSKEFRSWVSEVTGAGTLSGEKTDMAVNVYTPGSYLLCHDDVIGSRRVSYILYLTDPDNPWLKEWGGGLRLYPTELKQNIAGEDVKVPLAEHSLNIPPSFGQLSFFTVLPGESYHDVEEVYYGLDEEENKGRIRMAISGWYHIPQVQEEGYEVGLEQAQAQKSSLAQLKGAINEFDEPQIKFRHFDESRSIMSSNAIDPETDPGDQSDYEDDILSEQDLTFLLQYIRPQYLTPDMIEEISTSFHHTSVLQLEQFMCDKFASEVHRYLEAAANTPGQQNKLPFWKVARPPHKHRYTYLEELNGSHEDNSPISKLLVDLIRSHAFKKWIALVTKLDTKNLTRQHAIARRFRRGKDYALASVYPHEHPQLEFTISLTPSTGQEDIIRDSNGVHEPIDRLAPNHEEIQVRTSGQVEYGGEEVYMAGDDDDSGSIHSKSLPYVGKKADPAVYKAADEGDDDGILFANTPTWNQFSIVLRDKGTLRFVKYISQAAKGDRWDIKGEIELATNTFEDNDSEEDVDASEAWNGEYEDSQGDSGDTEQGLSDEDEASEDEKDNRFTT